MLSMGGSSKQSLTAESVGEARTLLSWNSWKLPTAKRIDLLTLGDIASAQTVHGALYDVADGSGIPLYFVCVEDLKKARKHVSV